eukprot:scaffold3522_cov82-Skeletonema_dohrnii-CCMP3373.AAC.8
MEVLFCGVDVSEVMCDDVAFWWEHCRTRSRHGLQTPPITAAAACGRPLKAAQHLASLLGIP